METDYEAEGSRPNEGRTFNYLMTGQMFVGDQDLIEIEPKKGFTFEQVEAQLRKDFKGLRVVEKKFDKNKMYITGKPKLELEQT